MKRVAVTVSMLVLLASSALASEPVVCTVTTGTGAATSTASPTTGTCSWPAGATVLMQCSTDTYIDSSTVAGLAPTATNADESVDFTNNKDKVAIYLNPTDQVISLLAVSAAGSCKFMTTLRRRPF